MKNTRIYNHYFKKGPLGRAGDCWKNAGETGDRYK